MKQRQASVHAASAGTITRGLCLMTAVIIASACGATPLAEVVFRDYWAKIATNPPPAVSFRVDRAVSKSGNDAYSIRERDGALVFTGSNARSVLYAVYDFFGRKGCSWFWDGDRLPPKGAVAVGGTDVREESKFEYRAIRYFAHRGLARFQSEHWGLEDWKKEIDWCLKRRLNCLMPRIGMDDVWQKAFPDIVPYPDPARPVLTGRKGYDNRDLFWPLQYRGELRKALTDYATERGLYVPTDFGTMTHWYARTPQEFLDAKNPPFLPQATRDYSEKTGLVWDIFRGEWLANYWHLTETSLAAGYGGRELLHTIGLGERLCYSDRAKNLKIDEDVMAKLFELAGAKSPQSKILLAGWDFYSTWSPAEVRDFVSGLDPEKVIVWDYEADAVEGWNPRFLEPQGNFTHWGLIGRVPYTFGIFLAYEAALDIRANYPLIEARQKLVENDPMCKGYIFWPESSHTDTFLLRYFTANAWKGGKASTELLPEFCRERYGAQAAAFENVWRRVIPASALLDWGGNYASRLTSATLKDEEADPWGRPLQDWFAALRGCEDTFAALAEMKWTDGFARRDSVDLARTLLDRLLEAKRRQLVWSVNAWRNGILGEQRRFDAVVGDFEFLHAAMTRLLALHEDYSLADSLDRLDATHPVANPNFGHVLVDNAVNGYCRSHQYEAAAFWYEPLARDCAAAVRAKVASGDRATPIDTKALAAKSEAYHQSLLTRPLAEMRPTAPRTEAAFRTLMRELARRPLFGEISSNLRATSSRSSATWRLPGK